MSTDRLRAELHRIGESAPPARIAPDTWSRAHRARLRDRALVAAAVLAVVGLVGALAGVLPDHRTPPVAAGADLGVPSHVWAVPERMQARDNDGSWMRSQVSSDVAVGRAAVAYVAADGLPVVVGAADGAYHLLDLPDFAGNDASVARGLHGGELALELSPDGRQLAYTFARVGPGAAAEPIPSGIRVLDLDTGAVREIPVPGREGTVVSWIRWSPDGRWLVWSGHQQDSWTAFSMGGSNEVAGRIAPGATSSEPVPLGRGTPTALAVSDTGLVAVLRGESLVRWDGRVLGRTTLRTDELSLTPGGAFDPAGRSFAYGGPHGALHASTMDVATGAITRRRLPADIYPDGADVRPLGWVDDDLMVLHLVPEDTADEPPGEPQVVIASRDVSRTSTYRVVAHTDEGVPATLSVAVDLMTADRPTVDRPEPDWPWSDEHKALVVGLGVAGAAALLWGARSLWRRRS